MRVAAGVACSAGVGEGAGGSVSTGAGVAAGAVAAAVGSRAVAGAVAAVAAGGAGVVLCPSTEANLGDGVPDLPRWLAAGVPLSIGSDSQVCRSAAQELRWLEYAQRLVRARRNVAADPAHFDGSTGARLFEACLADRKSVV